MKIIDQIKELKAKRNAVILAHNYQLPEIHDIADFVGDSLGLSHQASQTDAEVIVFCGVHFMAETAKILSPQKTVLLPDKNAGCPMADMIDPESLADLQASHPDAVTLCYVNTSAAVKAHCDYCCTSANAEKMARHILTEHREIIFVPDKYLARYVSDQINHKFITWEGFCPVHAQMTPENIQEARKERPSAIVLVHPECRPELTALADVVTSTEGMCRYVKNSPKQEFVIGTEIGIIHRMKKENPNKNFYPVSNRAVCPNMKRNNLEKVFLSLKNLTYEITIAPDIISRARQSIERMLKII